jgi:hypothetical protein
MSVKLSALGAGRALSGHALLPRNIICMLLVIISVRGWVSDRLCGLVVRVLDYRSEGPGSIPDTTRFSEKKTGKQVVCLERGPLNLVSTTGELLDRKVAAPV